MIEKLEWLRMTTSNYYILGHKGRFGHAILRNLEQGFLSCRSIEIVLSGYLIFKCEVPSDVKRNFFIIANGKSVSSSQKEVCELDSIKLGNSLDSLESHQLFQEGDFVVFLSSGGTVYGQSKNQVYEFSDLNPTSFYASEKLLQEKIVENWCLNRGLIPIILRIANAYEPIFDIPKGLIENLIHAIKNGEITDVYADLSSRKQYGQYSDYASRIIEIANQVNSTKINLDLTSGVINVFSKYSYSIAEILEGISLYFGVKKERFAKKSENGKVNLDSVHLATIYDQVSDVNWKDLGNSLKSIKNLST